MDSAGDQFADQGLKTVGSALDAPRDHRAAQKHHYL